MKKIDIIIVFLITCISIFLLKDLFKPGFYTSHDGPHQIVRLNYFDQALKDGQFPPRWSGGLLHGFGYPIFIFSYHMPWVIGEIIHLSGFSIIDSVKLTFLVGFILSGIFMYIFQKEVYSRTAAVGSTALYLLAPYRFSNIFVRAAIGDATSFIFTPILFLSLYKLKSQNKMNYKWIIIGGISITALLLSHALVFFFYMIGFFIYSFISLFLIKKKTPFIISSVLMFLISLGLSSYYLIPSVIERQYTVFSGIMNQMILGGNEFLTLKDLIYSPWGYGMFHSPPGAMSLQLGITQWLVLFASVITIILSMSRGVKDLKKNQDPIIFLIIILVTIYLTLSFSIPVWKFISNIVIIDFPWRGLAMVIFSISYLGGLLISSFKLESIKIAVTIGLIILALYANRNHVHINESLNWNLPFFLKLESTTNSFDEYTPSWVNKSLTDKPKPKVEYSSPNSQIYIKKNTSNDLEFDINTKTKGIAKINTIYYPGWNVKVNGKETKINYQSGGLMEFPLSKGTYQVIAKFQETTLRKLSNLITLLTLGFSLILVIKYRKDA